MEAHGADLQELATAHPAVGSLPALLEQLQRRDNLTIGTERAQHAAALLARLAAQGVRLATAETATAWLAPVLCVTAHDRRTLAERLQRMATVAEAAPRNLPLLPGEMLVAGTARATRQGWLLGLGVVGAAVVAIGTLALFGDGGGGGGGGGVAATGRIGDVLPWLMPPLALLLFGLLAARAGRGKVTRLPPVEFRPTGRGFRWFDEGILQGPLRLMGRQRSAPGRWLDLPGTIGRTVRQAGWPTLVRGGRPRTPEHVLLVQASSVDDPQLLVAAAVLDRLRIADLRVTAFTYAGTPDWLRPWGGGPAVGLARAVAPLGNARLVVLSDGAAFHDAFTGAGHVPEVFAPFVVHVLLTPVPQAEWSWREAALERHGWRLLPQSTEGVAELAVWLAGPREAKLPLRPVAAPALDLAAQLGGDARMFLEEPPSPALRARLLDRLAQWLDPDPRLPPAAFDLLRVLAVGTRLSPGTVERVEAHLATLGMPQPEEERLRRLLRLPWFGRGMPLWLREDLLRGVRPELASAARQAWLLHLADRGPDKGGVSPAQEARLAAEARRRLASRSSGADGQMRAALGLDEAEVPRTDWRLVAMAAGIAAGSGAAAWLLLRHGAALVPVVDLLFAPLVALFQRDKPWLALVAPACALAVLATFLPDRVRWGMAALAAYLALGGAWLAGADPTPTQQAVLGYGGVWAGSMTACFGLLVLGLVRPPAREAAPPRVVPAGHPWLNAAAVGLVAAAFALAELVPAASVAGLLGLHLALAAIHALLALAVLPRLVGRDGGAWRIALRAAAAAALVIGGFAIGQAVSGVADAAVFDVRQALALTACILVVLAGCGLPVPWQRIAIVLPGFVIISVATAVTSANTATPAGLALEIGIMLLPLAVMALLVGRERNPGGWRVGLAAACGVVAASAAGYAGTELPASIGAMLPWLAMWPLVRALRPELVTPSDGLGWRCLLLAACWVSFGYGTVSLGGYPMLAPAIAGWIAARHGTRALPAIALALAPMALNYTLRAGPMFFSLGGNPGHALAALLVARFVADRSFREACLTATTMAPWQMAALVILPLSYASPLLAGLHFVANGWPLALAVAGMVGLSQVPLRAPLLAMAAGIGSAAAGNVLAALFADPIEFGTVRYGLDSPGSLVSVALAFGLARMLRGEAFVPGTLVARLAASVREQPVLVAGIVAPVAYVIGIQLSMGGWSLSLSPLFITHYLLLALFWAASRAAPDEGFPQIAVGRWQMPWPLLLAAPAILIALAPELSVQFGLLRLRAFGRGYGSLVGDCATLYGFWRMGLALRPMLAAAPRGQGLGHPAFRTLPVLIGLGLAMLSALALVGLAVATGVMLAESGSPPPSAK